MIKMYPAVVNSPKTELVAAITQSQTDISVTDVGVLLSGEGIATIGNGDAAETITYTSVQGNTLKGCVRGYQGIARAWTSGTRVARNFAAADWDAARENILKLSSRLDTPERSAITLQPGIHVVQADQDSAFKLAGLQGRTVLNYQSQIGIFGVLNPYVIRYGENLLPPFYEWGDAALAGSNTIDNPYQLKMIKASGVVGFNTLACKVNASALTDYTLAITVDMSGIGGTISAGAYWNAGAYAEDGTLIEDFTQGPFVTTNGTKTMVRSFKTPANTKYVRLVVGLDNGTTGTAVFRDVTLNVGTTAKPFKPRQDAMLALQTELHANPDTGVNPDMVFERDGQYFKLAKWRRVVLDGALVYRSIQNKTGYKIVGCKMKEAALSFNKLFVCKYNADLLTKASTMIGPDNAYFLTADLTDFNVSIATSDSGWGDTYRPEDDEVKAYFMGWRMRNWNDTLPYTGTGEKAWGTIASGGAAQWTATLPTQQAPNWTPYQLLYQLATPTVELITSEGQLTFVEGDNQVEVGTGIVLRESVKPQLSGDKYYINSKVLSGSLTKHTPRKINSIYRASKPDKTKWLDYVDGGSNGITSQIPQALYDPAAAYSVTYLMLDKYPAAEFTGTYAENEKALLLDTVKSIQENTTRISVLESKKAEKDSPAWITPTLLNGWANFADAYNPASYYKDSMGIVRFRGLIKGGATAQYTTLLALPPGYRPSKSIIASSITDNGTTSTISRLEINNLGQVVLVVGSNTFLSLEGISFSASL